MKAKFKLILSALIVLWGVALIQILATRFYVSKSAFRQAFTRNEIVVTKEGEAASDTRNIRRGNLCREGTVEGRLDGKKRNRLAEKIFREFGGTAVMQSDEENENYYIAYGYTNGIAEQKHVNGKTINMSVAMAYDETLGKTRIVVGIPVVNSDF